MASNNNETHLIRLLNINDVLLGRGGPNKFIGNVRFRELVQSRKAEYVSHDSYNEKKRIATEGVFDVISFRGGRFLKLIRIENIPGQPPRSAIEAGVWEVVPRTVALEKCKQALREKDPKPKEAGKSNTTEQEENSVIEYPSNHLAGALEAQPTAATFPIPQAAGAQPNVSSASHAVPATLLARPVSLAADPRLLLCQQSLLTLQQQSLIQHQQQLAPSYPLQLNLNLQNPSIASGVSHAQFLHNMILQSQLRALMMQATAVSDSHDRDTVQQNEKETRPKHDSASSSTASESDDREDAAFALSALAIADHPQFTEEQEQIEQSQMSSEERVAALCDLFGKCALAGTHPNKKAKRDLDRESLDFLVAQMRLELELIPANKKQAFMEARAKCRPEEFSDARLERFLRCEGMNTKVSNSYSPIYKCRLV